MATTYVPVPFPAWSRKGTRMESSIPVVRGAGLVDTACETSANNSRRTRGGVPGSTATLVKSEDSAGCSWTETSVSLNLVGYEILEKRSKVTVWV